MARKFVTFEGIDGRIAIDNLEPSSLLNESQNFLIEPFDSTTLLTDIVLEDVAETTLRQLINEFRNAHKLSQFGGLKPTTKILLEGSSGCGKTLTAIAIASELKKRLLIVNLNEIISSRLGETSKNLSQTIRLAKREGCILFFDEFDSLSKDRTDERELGEMKRVVNGIIQLMDHSEGDMIVIAATNHLSVIDTAILRRFETIIPFRKPTVGKIKEFLHKLEVSFSGKVRIANKDRISENFVGQDFFSISNRIKIAAKRKILATDNMKNCMLYLKDFKF